MRWSPLVSAILLAAATAFTAACGSSTAGSLDGHHLLVIGYSAPLSGPLADEGKLMQEGYQIWADTVNRQGGLDVNGRSLKIQLKSYDDQGVPATAAANTQQLISVDKVDFLLGPYGNASVLQAAGVARQNKRLLLDSEGTANSIFAGGNAYVVGNVPPASQFGTAAVTFLAAENPQMKLAIVWSDDDTATQQGQAAMAQAAALGMQVVLSRQYPAGTSDFSSLLMQAKSAGADALVAAGDLASAVPIATQEQQLSFLPQATIQLDGPQLHSFAGTLGPVAEKQFGTSAWAGAVPQFADAVFGSAALYAESFKEQFGVDPDAVSAQASAGAEILGQAIQLADSLDQSKVLVALHKLESTTIGGPFKANAAGYNDKGLVVTGQVQQGRFVTVSPGSYALGPIIFPAN